MKRLTSYNLIRISLLLDIIDDSTINQWADFCIENDDFDENVIELSTMKGKLPLLDFLDEIMNREPIDFKIIEYLFHSLYHNYQEGRCDIEVIKSVLLQLSDNTRFALDESSKIFISVVESDSQLQSINYPRITSESSIIATLGNYSDAKFCIYHHLSKPDKSIAFWWY